MLYNYLIPDRVISPLPPHRNRHRFHHRCSAHYRDAVTLGQCGGQLWTGPTLCPDGAACVSSIFWFYQCLATPTTSLPSATSMPTTLVTMSVGGWDDECDECRRECQVVNCRC
ncbi:hypothetical protein BJ878DRAFT_259561 [Calycina marina]|uniref:CBM1 domain-containing protein n=1 Tax=Calycina marina TaxID=1763456 RepID=A0A9P7YWB4_9HELO|nr:hypothetical protein BJ878DRAFT_259561 [Calycina marina]